MGLAVNNQRGRFGRCTLHPPVMQAPPTSRCSHNQVVTAVTQPCRPSFCARCSRCARRIALAPSDLPVERDCNLIIGLLSAKSDLGNYLDDGIVVWNGTVFKLPAFSFKRARGLMSVKQSDPRSKFTATRTRKLQSAAAGDVGKSWTGTIKAGFGHVDHQLVCTIAYIVSC